MALILQVIIGIDSQAAIRLLDNQQSKPAAYLLNKIHTAAKKFQEHQDHLQCKADF